MDYENLGFGAGGGILGAILAFFGIKYRLNSMEEKIENRVSRDELKNIVELLVNEMNAIKMDIREIRDYLRKYNK